MATFDSSNFKYILKKGESASTTRLIGYELEIEREDRTAEWMQYEIGDDKPFAAYGYDGSDIELVTHPISVSMLRDDSLISEATQILKDKNCKPCEQGGTHVNVSKLTDDYTLSYSNLLWLQTIYAGQMQKVFGRVSSWAQIPSNKMGSDGYRKKKERLSDPQYVRSIMELFLSDEETAQQFSRMQNKSLLITDKGNRYEFRGGKSTTDRDELLAWGQFCFNMVEIASTNKKLTGVKFKNFLKGDMISRYVQEVLQTSKHRKLSEDELNKTVNSKAKLITGRQTNRILN